MTVHYFTFGQVHTATVNLPLGGRLADYWVTVDLPDSMGEQHREHFVEHFTKPYCPTPNQFAFEYVKEDFIPGYFPKGELCIITEQGFFKDRYSDD